MRLKASLGFAAAGMMVLAFSAWSHHAHGNYTEGTIDMEGVVTEFHLINPHSWVYMEVTKADGQKQLWSLEASGKGGLERAGITRDYLKKGDKIKARCHPLKDGGPSCLLGFVKAADGTVKDWDSASSTELPRDF
jgi:Family of unknown function (DUF6152)